MARSQQIDSCIVCHNVDCEARGSVPIGEEIAQRLASAGSDVQVRPYICFGACTQGPNIVLYPEGTWYSEVQQSDVEGITQHILGGQRVERISDRIDPGLRNLILQILDSGLGQFAS